MGKQYKPIEPKSQMVNDPISYPLDVSPVNALGTLIKGQSNAVRKKLAQRLKNEEYKCTKAAQQRMLKESMTEAFKELHSGQVKKNARELFIK